MAIKLIFFWMGEWNYEKKIFAIVSITLFLVFLMVTQGGTNDYLEVYFTGGGTEAVDSQPLAGQIIVDQDTKMWLAYNRDFNVDGKKDPFFMCGPGDPEGFLYRGTRNGDQMTLINKMKGTGANSIYLMAVRSHGGDGDSTQNPFVDSDPTKALDDDILNQWETWFTEMDNNGSAIFFFFYDDNIKVSNNLGWPLDSSGNRHS